LTKEDFRVKVGRSAVVVLNAGISICCCFGVACVGSTAVLSLVVVVAVGVRSPVEHGGFSESSMSSVAITDAIHVVLVSNTTCSE